MNTNTQSRSRNRGRRQLIALAALFFVPLAVAFWLYYGESPLAPEGGTNKGDLIDPARPLPRVSLPIHAEGETAPDFLTGQWSMLYIGRGACDERCRKALYLTRQTRIALNKDFDRVQRIFLVSADCCDDLFLSTEHPDLLLVLLEGSESQRLLQAFPTYDGIAVTGAGRIYLVDPLGNLLMSYSEAAPDKALLKDLKKLLRLSHIG